MTIENRNLGNSTTTTGAVILSTALFGLATMSPPIQFATRTGELTANYTDYKGQIRHWESRLLGTDKSGGEVLTSNDTENFAGLFSFASQLIKESNLPPKEFEKTFRKKFKDILA